MKFIAILALLAFVPALQGAGKSKHGFLSPGDYKFLSRAAQAGITEATLGEIARQRGSSLAVRNFGELMVDDHGKINVELQKIASAEGVALPSEIIGKHRQATQHLLELEGAEFDRAYARYLVKDHRASVKQYQEAARILKDADLKGFAAETLPILQEHLRMAEDLRKLVRGK